MCSSESIRIQFGGSRIVMKHVENAEINLFYKDN